MDLPLRNLQACLFIQKQRAIKRTTRHAKGLSRSLDGYSGVLSHGGYVLRVTVHGTTYWGNHQEVMKAVYRAVQNSGLEFAQPPAMPQKLFQ